jgi:ribosomal protein S7
VRPRNKQLSEKYKALRLSLDTFYSSRVIQTFFNKFVKQGKRITARKHLYRALRFYRMLVHGTSLRFCLLGCFYRLRVQFLLIPKRQARKYVEVPVPVRRNKRDTISLQTVYKAVTNRRERVLAERIQSELLALTVEPQLSPTLRARIALIGRVFDERPNMEKRWK